MPRLARSLLLALTVVGCRQIIFQPTAMSSDRRGDLARRPGWSADDVSVAPDVTLVGLVSRVAEPGSPWLLFFGGNASSLEGNQVVLSVIQTSTAAPFGMAVYAYRGYDGSGGEPDEPALLEDGHRVVAHLEETFGIEPSRLVVAGQSLGTGVAAAVSARLCREGRPPRATILISPYRSIGRVFDDFIPIVPVGWTVSDQFSTEDIIRGITSPILIVHGGKDDLIDVEHGRVLARLGGVNTRYVEVGPRGHNDVWKDPQALRAIAETLFPAGRAPDPDRDGSPPDGLGPPPP